MTSRQAALMVLEEVLGSRHRYLNLALKDVHGLGDADQRFTTALVSGTLEHLITIDYILEQFTDIRKSSLRVRNVLRLGVCQIMYLDGVPDPAAVNESVSLISRSSGRVRGYVNGVLRNIVRSRHDIKMPDKDKDFVKYLSVVYSYPEWICTLFVDQLGHTETEKLLSYTGVRGSTCLRRTCLAESEQYPDSRPGIYLDDAVYVKHVRDIASDPMITSGRYTVQSESSMLCVRALGLRPDSIVLDLCAAPGGKSAYAAQLVPQGEVKACDVHEHRCELIRATAARLGAENLHAQVWDATIYNPAWEERFDAVLVDAPCSALGLLYRKPDIRYSRTKPDLDSLARTQRAILACAQAYVRPGGILLYTTCTIDRLENQDVAEWFVSTYRHFSRDDLSNSLPGVFAERAVTGQIQLLPPRDNIDGFFISGFHKSCIASEREIAGECER